MMWESGAEGLIVEIIQDKRTIRFRILVERIVIDKGFS